MREAFNLAAIRRAVWAVFVESVLGVLLFHETRSTKTDLSSCCGARKRDERAASSVTRLIEPGPWHYLPSLGEFARAEPGFVASRAAIKR
jgi:hypothetical protein